MCHRYNIKGKSKLGVPFRLQNVPKTNVSFERPTDVLSLSNVHWVRDIFLLYVVNAQNGMKRENGNENLL